MLPMPLEKHPRRIFSGFWRDFDTKPAGRAARSLQSGGSFNGALGSVG